MICWTAYFDMDTKISALFFALGLSVGMFLFLEVGRRLGQRRRAKEPDEDHADSSAVQGAIFALFGLLVAFTFSGAASRFDSRRQLINEETNAIGTAFLRLDLLSPGSQPGLRELFRKYVDSRLEVYRRLSDVAAAKQELAHSAAIQHEIWTQAIAASRLSDSHPDAAKLLLPALNAMIDITATRTMASRIHPPLVIFCLLFVLGLGCSLLAGYGMSVNKRRNWLHIVLFVTVVVGATYTILDIEYPRRGLIRVTDYDQVLVELRDTMK
jgi:hypothetical protein